MQTELPMTCETRSLASIGVGSSPLLEPQPRKRGSILPLAIMATAAIGIDGFGGLWRSRTSSQELRNDPRREKTRADLAAIAAASERRARREAARKTRANQTEGFNGQDEAADKRPTKNQL